MLALVLMGGCASGPTKPLDVAWAYWTARARLDPACADLVESAHRDEVRRTVTEGRRGMKEDFPDLDQFRYVFGGLRAELVTYKGNDALVRIRGRAEVRGPDGKIVDAEDVNEVLRLTPDAGRRGKPYRVRQGGI